MNKILTICLMIIVVFATVTVVFKVPINVALVYGAILLCPLMHLFMMKHGGHREKSSEDHSKH